MSPNTMAALAAEPRTAPMPLSAATAGYATTLALTLVLLFSACGLVVGVVLLTVQPVPIPRLGIGQRQTAETALYLASFGLLLPAALIGGPRFADVVARGPNRAGLSALAALLATGLFAALLLTRLSGVFSWGGGASAMLVSLSAWSLAAAAALTRAARREPWPALLRQAPRTEGLWSVAAVLALALPWTVVHFDSLSPLPVLLFAAVAAAIVLVWRRLPTPSAGRWWLLVDGAAALLLMLLAIDLVIITPENPATGELDRFYHAVGQFHADFLLRPANQVLGGDVLLVDVASQYGVGSIYFLAGWFKLVPIGYGTFGLLDGVLSGLSLVTGYVVLRIGGCSRLLSGAALAVGGIALVLNRVYPVGVIVQEGPLRFGFGMLVVLAAVGPARWPRWARAARLAVFALVGVASIWSLEALVLTTGTWLFTTGFEAYRRPAGERTRWLARQLGLAALACACAHILFAIATLVASGQLPEWGQYLAYLDAFLLGELGDLTYDFSSWSPGIAVGAAQLASAAALVLLILRSPDMLAGEPVLLTALVGTTAYGSVLFMYLVDRSLDHVVLYVSQPVLLTGTLWLHLVLRTRERLPRRVPAAALALALSVMLALVSVGWSSISNRFGHTALAHALPGIKSASDARERLWDFPPIDPRAPEAQRLLERHMPRERRSVVVVDPELGVETLLRSERFSRIPSGDPWVIEQRLPGVRSAVARLQPGELMLTHTDALAMVAKRRGRSLSDLPSEYGLGSPLAPLEVAALQEILKRFRLEPVERSEQGLIVMRLVVRR
jgi:hypothetical protein